MTTGRTYKPLLVIYKPAVSYLMLSILVITSAKATPYITVLSKGLIRAAIVKPSPCYHKDCDRIDKKIERLVLTQGNYKKSPNQVLTWPISSSSE